MVRLCATQSGLFTQLVGSLADSDTLRIEKRLAWRRETPDFGHSVLQVAILPLDLVCCASFARGAIHHQAKQIMSSMLRRSRSIGNHRMSTGMLLVRPVVFSRCSYLCLACIWFPTLASSASVAADASALARPPHISSSSGIAFLCHRS